MELNGRIKLIKAQEHIHQSFTVGHTFSMSGLVGLFQKWMNQQPQLPRKCRVLGEVLGCVLELTTRELTGRGMQTTIDKKERNRPVEII